MGPPSSASGSLIKNDTCDIVLEGSTPLALIQQAQLYILEPLSFEGQLFEPQHLYVRNFGHGSTKLSKWLPH